MFPAVSIKWLHKIYSVEWIVFKNPMMGGNQISYVYITVYPLAQCADEHFELF